MEAQDNKEETPWREFRDALLRFVMQRVSNVAAAEDIVQDVLVRAHTQQGTLREPSKLRPWLLQVTRNAVIDYYRRQKPTEAVSDALGQVTTAEDGDQIEQELARCLVPLLDTLPDPYRQALRLTEFDGARQREVASLLGLSLSGAKSRVQRGRKMLRDALLSCCRVELDHLGRAVDYAVGDGCECCSRPGASA
jgi:RNA polymerase sigma-70 factor (ECF subfamily)